jgi:hypothetical protein
MVASDRVTMDGFDGEGGTTSDDFNDEGEVTTGSFDEEGEDVGVMTG